ncbi:hypothetical protein [Catenulispora rubra]|uniref:hypothetical protein n=1 Tax=Catenulispora rubra TaxID=280293 RepID=UPI001892321A|nr:hypothetical protein [Catenulispora rubra]
MNRDVSEAAARRRLEEMLRACHAENTRPSVLTLAGQLGMSNTTFRRRFPEIASEIAAHRTPSARTPADGRARTTS